MFVINLCLKIENKESIFETLVQQIIINDLCNCT